MYIYIYTYIYICVCICISLHIYRYIYVCTYIEAYVYCISRIHTSHIKIFYVPDIFTFPGVFAIGDIRNTPFKQVRVHNFYIKFHMIEVAFCCVSRQSTLFADCYTQWSKHALVNVCMYFIFLKVVVAASDGCIAAMSIDRYLKGRKKVRVDWVHA